MRYFLDTEFVDDGNVNQDGLSTCYGLTLLSLALVAEDGREFYAVAQHHAPDLPAWHQANLVPHFRGVEPMSDWAMRDAVLAFLRARPDPEVWCYFGAHDWVLLSSLLRVYPKAPAGLPDCYFELHQEMRRVGVHPRDVPHPGVQHHALHDARWHRDMWRAVKMKEMGA